MSVIKSVLKVLLANVFKCHRHFPLNSSGRMYLKSSDSLPPSSMSTPICPSSNGIKEDKNVEGGFSKVFKRCNDLYVKKDNKDNKEVY